MSDHDITGSERMGRDPIDQAYVQAEAMLDDAHALAARRARVLAAVAAQPAAIAPTSTHRRAPFAAGGWLIAASVAAVSVMVALQIRTPIDVSNSAPPAVSTAAPRELSKVAQQPAPTAPSEAADTASAHAPAAEKAPRYSPPGAGTFKPAAPTMSVEQSPTTPSASAPAPASPPQAAHPLPVPPVEHRIEEPRPPVAARADAPTANRSDAQELVVTSERRRSPREEAGDQLRNAAEAGRADEVATLLAKGAPVDLPDDAGDTALMKSVRADHPAVVVLLRRRGASLDRRNRAGESVRELAIAVGDPELDRALSLRQ